MHGVIIGASILTSAVRVAGCHFSLCYDSGLAVLRGVSHRLCSTLLRSLGTGLI